MRLFLCLCTMVCFTVFPFLPSSAAKLGIGTSDEPPAEETSEEQGRVQYVKYGAWFYEREEDAGREVKDVERDDRKLIEMGSRITTIEQVEREGETYSRVRLPDRSEYWVKSEALVDRFIVINTPDVLCYRQPDDTFADTIFLEPGDMGYYLDRQEGWIKASFLAYRPREPEGKRLWVGEKWIKDYGYTEDVMAAKEAYYLFLANREVITRDNAARAVELLETGLNVNVVGDTDITSVLRDRLREIRGEIADSPGTTSDDGDGDSPPAENSGSASSD